MKKNLFLWAVVFGLIGLQACSDVNNDPIQFEEIETISGDLDATRFVALGNSLTAGYQSGGWTWEMHNESFVTLIANQLYGSDRVGADYQLHQFLMARIPQGGNPQPSRIVSQEVVGEYPDGTPVVNFQLQAAGIRADNFMVANYDAPPNFNNLAVPGYTGLDILTTTTANNLLGGFNPLFQLTLRNASDSRNTSGRGSALAQALAKEPTLATVWAGNNEVLGSATSGAVNPPYPLEDTGGIPGFKSVIDDILNPLLAAGTKIALANVPDVTAIPFVSGIGVEGTNGNKVFLLDLNGDGTWSNEVNFWGTDPSDGQVRAVQANEYVLLPWLANVDFTATEPLGLHPNNPLPPNLWLTESEVTMLRGVVTAYNQYLADKAAGSPNIVLVDMNGLFQDIVANNGIPELGLTLDLFVGGIFSLDGVHPTSAAHRVAANTFIDAINEGFGAQISPVSLNSSSMSMQSTKVKPDLTQARESGLADVIENVMKLYQ